MHVWPWMSTVPVKKIGRRWLSVQLFDMPKVLSLSWTDDPSVSINIATFPANSGTYPYTVEGIHGA